jgi:hypothetical protein
LWVYLPAVGGQFPRLKDENIMSDSLEIIAKTAAVVAPIALVGGILIAANNPKIAKWFRTSATKARELAETAGEATSEAAKALASQVSGKKE